MRTVNLAGAISVVAIFFTLPAAAELFTVTDLGTLPGFTASVAIGINNRGQVAGTALADASEGCFGHGGTDCEAFLYSGGSMIGLGTLGANPFVSNTSSATGINNNGQVVGDSTTPTGGDAFLYNNNLLGALNIPDGSSSNPVINDLGEIAGTGYYGNDLFEAFLDNNGVFTLLGTMGAFQSYATGINNRGQITGYVFTPYLGSGSPCALLEEGFIYDNGVMTGLGTLGGSYSVAYAINNAGVVVGYSTETPCGLADAFVYKNGVMTGLGTLSGYDSSFATAVNNSGQIVGFVASQLVTSPKLGPEAFLYENGSMTDISPAGWSETRATGINDKGQIVGYGLNPAGQEHGFLLTPVPESSSVFLLGVLALFFMVGSKRRSMLGSYGNPLPAPKRTPVR